MDQQKERLNEFLKYKGMSMRTFETKLGLYSCAISKAKNPFSPERIRRIQEEFQDLNTIWLLTGVGPMIKHKIGGDTNINVDYSQYYDCGQVNRFSNCDAQTGDLSANNETTINTQQIFQLQMENTMLQSRIKFLEEQVAQLTTERDKYIQMLINPSHPASN